MTGDIIDSHQHFWDPTREHLPWLTPELGAIRREFGPEHLQPCLERSHVTGTIVVQVCPDPTETIRLLSLAEEVAFIQGVVGWVDLTAGVCEQLDDLMASPGGHYLVGVRHDLTSEPDPDWIGRPDVSHGLQVLADAGLSYDIEATARELRAVTHAVGANPKLRFVLDHLGKPVVKDDPDPDWVTAMSALGQFDNVWAKVSGLVTEADWVRWTQRQITGFARVAYDTFGPTKLLFGSDWPVCTLAASYEQVAEADWLDDVLADDRERELVRSVNTRDAYRLASQGEPSKPAITRKAYDAASIIEEESRV